MDEDDDPITTKTLRLFIAISVFFQFSAGDDAAVMVKLARSLKPSGWSGSNPCRWPGVTCDSSDSVVTSINLESKSISGELPPDVSLLSGLKFISLERNNLFGPLPPMANLPLLEELSLDGNNFSSMPPSFLSGLTGLQKLSINDNPNLPPWTIPNALANSTALVSLLAANCNLIGTIPDIFGSLPNLQDLRLSYNNLMGTLPPSLGKSEIQNLWINNQRQGLSGRLDVLRGMTQLKQVWVHVNQFSGPIPDLSNSVSLFDIQLRDNQLTGVVPPSLTTLPALVNISLQNNNLQGPTPLFPRGIQVNLGNTNSFCNPIPGVPCDPQVTALLAVAEGLGYPMALAESWEGNNPCLDWKSVSCDSKGSVSVINFAKQNWLGTISPAIANLTGLRTVLLNDNQLSGPIPDSLTRLDQLELLDVSKNNLSGKIPAFRPQVTVKASGNPLIGKDSRSGGSNTSNLNDDNGGSSENRIGPYTPPWVIALSTVFGVVLVVVVCLLIYRCLAKKRRRTRDGEIVMEKKKAEANSRGDGSDRFDLESQASSGCTGIHLCDGGNVAIPIEVLREVTSNFSDKNVVGKGGFGVVYRGQLHDGTQIAVKRMESTLLNSKGLNEFKAEIEVLTRVRHRHLVALNGFCIDGNERLLVYEYMPQGTLGQHLFEYDHLGCRPLTWHQRVAIALDVARGVEYLHGLAQQSFIHRDLKPSNILLGDDMRAKVSDFGLVKNAPDGKYSVETRLAGTFGYLAPEYAATGRVTTKIDVFSYGVILMEMISGRKALDEDLPENQSHLVPWFHRNLANNLDGIRNTLDPTLETADEESIRRVAELAGHCTAREPHQRPDMCHVVSVLSPLVEHWKPARDGNGDVDGYGYGYGIDFNITLPQALERWRSNVGDSSDDFSKSYSESSCVLNTPNSTGLQMI